MGNGGIVGFVGNFVDFVDIDDVVLGVFDIVIRGLK